MFPAVSRRPPHAQESNVRCTTQSSFISKDFARPVKKFQSLGLRRPIATSQSSQCAVCLFRCPDLRQNSLNLSESPFVHSVNSVRDSASALIREIRGPLLCRLGRGG